VGDDLKRSHVLYVYGLGYKLTVQARLFDGVESFQSHGRSKASTAVIGLGGHGRTEL
jgi:hypothetical protein